MKRILLISVFGLVSVCSYSQYATYNPIETPVLKLPDQPASLQRSFSNQTPKSRKELETEKETFRTTGYQYDSSTSKWQRLSLKVTIEEGISKSDIILLVAIKRGQYWQDVLPVRVHPITNKDSEFGYYVNLVGGTVYFNL